MSGGTDLAADFGGQAFDLDAFLRRLKQRGCLQSKRQAVSYRLRDIDLIRVPFMFRELDVQSAHHISSQPDRHSKTCPRTAFVGRSAIYRCIRDQRRLQRPLERFDDISGNGVAPQGAFGSHGSPRILKIGA